MEQVLNSHGVFALGLLALCGGMGGLKVGLWAVALLSSLCAVGVLALWLGESRALLRVAGREEPAAMTSVLTIFGKEVSRDGTAKL